MVKLRRKGYNKFQTSKNILNFSEDLISGGWELKRKDPLQF